MGFSDFPQLLPCLDPPVFAPVCFTNTVLGNALWTRSQESLENTAYHILKFNKLTLLRSPPIEQLVLAYLIDQFSILFDQGTSPPPPTVIENMLGTYYNVGPCYWSMVQRPVALASPGCLLEMQNLRHHPGLTESELAF